FGHVADEGGEEIWRQPGERRAVHPGSPEGRIRAARRVPAIGGGSSASRMHGLDARSRFFAKQAVFEVHPGFVGGKTHIWQIPPQLCPRPSSARCASARASSAARRYLRGWA